MDAQANGLFKVLQTTEVDPASKIDLTNKLKTFIKHRSVPASAVANSFECIRICLSDSELSEAGFSTLSHLSKRLTLQSQQDLLAQEGIKTFDILLERLGDSQERDRQRAIQAFIDFWSTSPQDVETFIRDKALTTKNTRAKRASMQWIVQVHEQFSLHFRPFVPHLINFLDDHDNGVRDNARSTIVKLFQNAPQHAKTDLEKQMDQHGSWITVKNGTWKAILDDIGGQINTGGHVDILPARKARKAEARPASVELPTAPTLVSGPSTLKNELDPIRVERNLTFTCRLGPANRNTTLRLDDCVIEMSSCFEGNESEKNWHLRETNIVILRRLTKGNAPTDFSDMYILQVKGLLDGIIKAVNSLRTSLSTHGCLLIQEAAKTVGPGLDPMVDIILQPLLKLCGNTKNIAAQNANTTINILFNNVTYNHRFLQHIWNACQEKNVRPRGFAPMWLKTIILRHQGHSSILEHASGLETIEKIFQRGFGDADPGVRNNVRDTYWTFWSVWPARAESMMHSLKSAARTQLIQHPSNPGVPATIAVDIGSTKAPPPARTIVASTSRPSLKETMMASRKNKATLDRPQSAMSAVSTVATANMSSAPKRPTKAPIKKAEVHGARAGGHAAKTAASSRPAASEEPLAPEEPSTSKETSVSEEPLASDPISTKTTKVAIPTPAPDDKSAASSKSIETTTDNFPEMRRITDQLEAMGLELFDQLRSPGSVSSKTNRVVAITSTKTTKVAPLTPASNKSSTTGPTSTKTSRAVTPTSTKTIKLAASTPASKKPPATGPKSVKTTKVATSTPTSNKPSATGPRSIQRTKVDTPASPTPAARKPLTTSPDQNKTPKFATPVPTPNAITSDVKSTRSIPLLSNVSAHSRSSSTSGESSRSIRSVPPSKIPIRSESSSSRPSSSRSSSSEGSIKSIEMANKLDQLAIAHPRSGISTPARSRASTLSNFDPSTELKDPTPFVEPEQSSLATEQEESTITGIPKKALTNFDSFALQMARRSISTISSDRFTRLIEDIVASITRFDPLHDDSKLLSQQLFTLRDMSKSRRPEFPVYQPASVRALLELLDRRGTSLATTAALHECLDDLLLVADTQEGCMRAITAMTQSEHTYRTLAKLAPQVRSDLIRDTLQPSLMGMVEEGFTDEDAGIRRAATELGLALYLIIGDELTFWKAASRLSGDQKDLLMYYINRAHQKSDPKTLETA